MYTIYVIKPFNCASFRFGVGKSQAPHVGKGSRILMPLIQERYDTSVPVFDSDYFIDPVTLQPYDKLDLEDGFIMCSVTGEPITDLRDYIVVMEEGTDVCI